MQVFLGIIFGILISVLAWRLGSLTKSGAASAAITGSLIFGLGGLPWGALLLTFFITSSLLSKTFRRKKNQLSEKFSKGTQRDWGQVAANGGLGASLVILYSLVPPGNHNWIWPAYIGAMAAVTADTWATEIGVLNPGPPILITNGKKVETGTSGAISFYGTIATIAGAAVIGAVGTVFSSPGGRGLILAAAVLGGVFGSIFDSLLGATVQAIFECPICAKETERHPIHTCGSKTTRIRGWYWLNNDFVNFLASCIGAVLAAGTWYVFS
jgi:uncharacterized protein (TIGR00297 family)